MTYTKIIHDVVTGEISEVELNVEEIKQIEKVQEQDNIKQAEEEEELAAKAAEKATLLARLGITADEAKLLLG